MNHPLRLLLPATALLCASCAPTVQVSVPKPVVIDVNMKVDVTSRTAPGAVPAKPGAPATAADATTDAATEHNQLSGEVQSLKDNRLIGEDNRGYIDVRQTPAGKLADGEDYGAYIQRVVKAENDARRVLNLQRAGSEGVPLQTVESEAAKRWAEAAFPGEWVQEAGGEWKQKQK